MTAKTIRNLVHIHKKRITVDAVKTLMRRISIEYLTDTQVVSIISTAVYKAGKGSTVLREDVY